MAKSISSFECTKGNIQRIIFYHDIGYNNGSLTILCHVVYVTLGFTTVSHIIHATINAEIVKITTCHHYMSKRNSPLQMRWGILLLLAGLGVFFMIPQKMQEIEKIEHFSSYLPFIRFCFYFMSVLLIGGGAKKIYHHFRRTENTNEADNHK